MKFDGTFKPVVAALSFLSIEAFGGELALGAIPHHFQIASFDL
jgi:hypothetical protein